MYAGGPFSGPPSAITFSKANLMTRSDHQRKLAGWTTGEAACDGYRQMNRRALIGRMSGVGAGGLLAAASLDPLTALAEQLAKQDKGKSGRPKSLLMVWLQGGASQLETFDPHPG
ncbi:MAG TPA: hypothetical protein DDW52_21705, partial [Planctomycetaceae bacterium]|nr:hypothetical protein [Planctomycetaceae bacterium]